MYIVSMNKNTRYVLFFVAHAKPDGGPWPCHFCGEPVELCVLTVHHMSYPEVDTLDNLVATHGACHSRHHAAERGFAGTIRRWTPEQRDAQAAVMRRNQAAMTHDRTVAANTAWESRRAKYGPTGRPKTEYNLTTTAKERSAIGRKAGLKGGKMSKYRKTDIRVTCPECGFGPTTPQAIGAHKRFKHAV